MRLKGKRHQRIEQIVIASRAVILAAIDRVRPPVGGMLWVRLDGCSITIRIDGLRAYSYRESSLDYFKPGKRHPIWRPLPNSVL